MMRGDSPGRAEATKKIIREQVRDEMHEKLLSHVRSRERHTGNWLPLLNRHHCRVW